MTNLVYLSPVRWADFAQRPHKFVHWFHERHGAKVLWLEPYPSRFPKLRDLRRFQRTSLPRETLPSWLEVLQVPAFPLEPFAGSQALNAPLWRRVKSRVAEFAAREPCDLLVGKPSRLAVEIARQRGFRSTAYDAMDDFPAFHSGLSAAAIRIVERRLVGQVETVYASSTRLQQKFRELGAAVRLIRNACDPVALPDMVAVRAMRQPGLAGYIGTLGDWFDWQKVVALAEAHPDMRFELSGPLHAPPGCAMPTNVAILPACSHPEAMRRMARFSAGLIPFKCNVLTASVDPIKYYEYRAMGIPVLSTAFGEMPIHAASDGGIHLLEPGAPPGAVLDRALAFGSSPEWIEGFRRANGWAARFAAALSGAAERHGRLSHPAGRAAAAASPGD